jgi:hypothetical protein
MDKEYFSAVCPLQIGDVIHIESQYTLITDILLLHYRKSGKSEFKYELNNNGKYVILKKRKRENCNG